MTKKKIHKKFDQLFENPKSRNFINHLVRSYFPLNKVEVVKQSPSGDFTCSISRADLISKGDIIEGIRTKEIDEELEESLTSLFNEEKQADNPMRKSIGGRELAITAKKTDTYMTYKVFQEFFSWVANKMIEGDKHINWLLKKIDRECLIKRAEKIAEDVDSINAVGRMKNSRRPMTKLGDFGALQELKDKMDKEEK